MDYNIGIVTDYSLLSSLIKIPDLITFCKNNNISSIGIIDNNLYYSVEFYYSCVANNIKPIIGLNIKLDDKDIYLYAKNYLGYQELIKLDYLDSISINDINDLKNVIIVLPYSSYSLNSVIKPTLFYAYHNKSEFISTDSDNKVFINVTKSLYVKDTEYLEYIDMIRDSESYNEHNMINYKDNYYQDSYLVNKSFCDLIDIKFPEFTPAIPHFDEKISDSYNYLSLLSKKGLEKRLGTIKQEYLERLQYELSVIKALNFVDYFLIVYDYVKYAKKNDILVGPGRGSAAGSLVSYCLGITEIDPLKYDLLFERFLNKDRITMPDIDIDFEYNRRDLVIDYVINKYGRNYCAEIMTYGTMGSKQVIKDVGKVLEIESRLVDKLASYFSSSGMIKDNINSDKVIKLVNNNRELKNLLEIAIKLEGLKKHISTHAAGVVISDKKLINRVPLINNNGRIMTGVTMNYLESLGLLKMDFLALKNLTILNNVINLIEENEKIKIELRDISLEDKKTYDLLSSGNTVGVFQFESTGMINFLRKLNPRSFEDLIAAVALFRPGPMDNIDSFIDRKDGKESINYPVKELEIILENTYGIIVYQEQILQILNVMADYSYAEADIIRRAMSKKKIEIIEKERKVFINRAINKGYSEKISSSIYDLIMKFANYGFNKAHSVSYATLGFYMAYLKANYFKYFLVNLLNSSIGSDVKIKEYLDEAKMHDIRILKPSISYSGLSFIIKDKSLLMPLSSIKGLSINSINSILEERNKGQFKDFFDFVSRIYKNNINRSTIELLIKADVFSTFSYKKKTLLNNIDSAITYAELIKEIDDNLVNKPELISCDEFNELELMNQELELYGFHITNHPASKYNKVTKIKNIDKFFDKICDFVVIINRVNKIKTKKNDDMAFLEIEDETGVTDAVIFSDNIKGLDNIKVKSLVNIHGRVTKRYSKYQVTIINIKEIGA